MPDIKTIADKADVIINGYAFTRNEDRIQVLNLNSPDKAAVFNAICISPPSAWWSVCMCMPVTANSPKAAQPNSSSRAMVTPFSRTVAFSMTVRSLKLLISLRSIIRRCISGGLNTVTKAITRSNH